MEQSAKELIVALAALREVVDQEKYKGFGYPASRSLYQENVARDALHQIRLMRYEFVEKVRVQREARRTFDSKEGEES